MTRAFLVVPVCALALLTSAAAAEPIAVRLGSPAPTGTPWEDAANEWKADIAKQSHNSVRMKVLLGRSDEAHLIEACQKGEIEAIGVSAGALSNVVPALETLELPYLFNSNDEVDFVLDQYLTDPVSALLKKHNFVFFAWSENGWQSYGSRTKPILKPQDLVGVRARTQNSPAHINTWKTFGALPVPLPITETAAAMKHGDVDVLEQTPLFTIASGWTQAIKHYTLTRHIYQPAIMLFCNPFFDAQTAETRAALVHFAPNARATRVGVRNLEKTLLDDMRKSGVEVHDLDDNAREAFAAVARRAHTKFANNATPEALALLQVIVKAKAEFAKAGGKPQAR